MPEWNLADLYAGPDAPEVRRDIDRAQAEATRIKDACQGKLVGLAGGRRKAGRCDHRL